MGLLDGLLGGALKSVLAGATQPHPAPNAAGAQGGGVLGGVLGSLGGQMGSQVLLTVAMGMLQKSGGLEGILAKFRAQGHGKAVDSWVGTGENHEISGDQVKAVLGESTVSEVAKQLGTSHEEASGSLAALLPELINSLTPNGQIPANSSDLVKRGMELLKSQLSKP